MRVSDRFLFHYICEVVHPPFRSKKIELRAMNEIGEKGNKTNANNNNFFSFSLWFYPVEES
jgi:hypothetical protein